MKKIFIIFILSLCHLKSYSEPTATNATNDNTEKSSPQSTQSDGILDSLDYPELQVVPRASERLSVEAKDEQTFGWAYHINFQLSGLATLLTAEKGNSLLDEGLSSNEIAEAKDIMTGLKIVGGTWLIGMTILSFQHPYNEGQKRVNKISGTGKSKQLMRERISEETFERPAKLINTLTYISVISNFMANAFIFDKLNREGRVYASIGALFSFLPAIFDHEYVHNYEKHEEYKRKIYAPLVSFSTLPQKNHATFSQLNLTWFF